MANAEPLSVKSWDELRKGGGITFSQDALQKMFQKGDGELYSRSELVEKVTNYFRSCTKEVIDEESGDTVTVWIKNPTKSSLAVSLGLTPQVLIDYVNNTNSAGKPYSKDKPDSKRTVAVEDFDILRDAYAVISDFYESRLGNNQNNTGSIFWLLNSLNAKWTNEHTTILKTEESKGVNYTNEQIAARLGDRLQGYIAQDQGGDNENDD